MGLLTSASRASRKAAKAEKAGSASGPASGSSSADDLANSKSDAAVGSSGTGEQSGGANPDNPDNPAQPKTEQIPAIHALLSLERTRAKVAASSRKRALEHGCETLAGCNDMNARTVLDALLAREKLGSTALGDGIAIPHCRLADCTAPIGVLLSLADGVDYLAPDDEPVDLLFILVVPENANEAHLQILSALAGLLIEPDNRAQLRDARDNLTLFETLQRLSRSA